MGQLTQYDYLKGSLLQFNHQKEELTKKVKEYCQNKEFPLDKRWSLFIDNDLGEHNSWIQDFETIKIEKLANFNRYELILSNNLVELYFDYISDELYNELELTCNYETNEYEHFIKTEVNSKVDVFKEEILQLFIKSFEYDW